MDLSGFVDTLGTVAQGVGAVGKIAGGLGGLMGGGGSSSSRPMVMGAVGGDDDQQLFQMFLDAYLDGIKESYATSVRPVDL